MLFQDHAKMYGKLILSILFIGMSIFSPIFPRKRVLFGPNAEKLMNFGCQHPEILMKIFKHLAIAQKVWKKLYIIFVECPFSLYFPREIGSIRCHKFFLNEKIPNVKIPNWTINSCKNPKRELAR
jgi:hypothetical protein